MENLEMVQDSIRFPACFSSGDDPASVTRSGQSVFMSVYRTEIADSCRLITVTWCKNLLLHGLSVSVQGAETESLYTCKVELNPWCFWRKQGSKSFVVDGKPVEIFWDLKAAKYYYGETEPSSEYYVAVVCDEQVVLLLGDLKKDAYRKTGCRPALSDPTLVSRREHVSGKNKFTTRVKLDEKGRRFHEISIECKMRKASSSVDPEMEMRIDGELVIHVKHLQWKFRGNESINVNKARVQVYWDVHDWLFSPGLRHALFIFKPVPSISVTPDSSLASSLDGFNQSGVYEFCLFLYAWKV